MDLVILPHHNTLASLQQLQSDIRHLQTDERSVLSSCLFLPSYPLVCVLAHMDEAEAPEAAVSPKDTLSVLEKKMAALKDLLKNADGALSFPDTLIVQHKDAETADSACAADAAGTAKLILPVAVPFMNAVQAAGFKPVEVPHFTLGTWVTKAADDQAGTAGQAEITKQDLCCNIQLPSARAFRLALMQTASLKQTEAQFSDSAASAQEAFTWKFHSAFWVKLGR